MLAIAAALLAAQAVSLATVGERAPGPFLSESMQLLLGILCILTSVNAFRGTASVARYYWRWLAFTFSVWACAQALGVYVDVAPNGSLEPEKLKKKSMQTSGVEGAQVGDVVLCQVEQEKGNAFGNSNVVTHLKNCKKA